jgi:hypothetical protein
MNRACVHGHIVVAVSRDRRDPVVQCDGGTEAVRCLTIRREQFRELEPLTGIVVEAEDVCGS